MATFMAVTASAGGKVKDEKAALELLEKFGVDARIDTTKQDFLRLSQADWRRYRGVYLSAADFAASGMSADELIGKEMNVYRDWETSR